jgi:hypothetical protein
VAALANGGADGDKVVMAWINNSMIYLLVGFEERCRDRSGRLFLPKGDVIMTMKKISHPFAVKQTVLAACCSSKAPRLHAQGRCGMATSVAVILSYNAARSKTTASHVSWLASAFVPYVQ